ncbi:MAG: YqaE/Pmp3 family membrane protein [Bacteroidetes bacterium]|nr:YqaE/Pmp3 family membrane protein [Bacteroidota bacterium]
MFTHVDCPDPPPLAVYLHQGEINSKFWISLLLTLLKWVPGVVYALLVIFGMVA